MRNSFAIVNNGVIAANSTIGADTFVNISDKFSFNQAWLKDLTFIAPAAGSAGTAVITFASAPSVGDQFKITLSSQARSSQFLTKTYSHTVTTAAGATVNAVAAAFTSAIQADIDAGMSDVFASAVNTGAPSGVVTITQADDDKKAIQCLSWTDSATTTATVVVTATTYSEGQPSDLLDAGVPQSEITLAAYDTVKILLSADAPIPFIDSAGKTVSEIIAFVAPGQGTVLNGRI